jgi:hypothetical protein
MGEAQQAIGVSRGGRTSNIHALIDARGRPLRIIIAGGQVHDSKVARDLIDVDQLSPDPSRKIIQPKNIAQAILRMTLAPMASSSKTRTSRSRTDIFLSIDSRSRPIGDIDVVFHRLILAT